MCLSRVIAGKKLKTARSRQSLVFTEQRRQLERQLVFKVFLLFNRNIIVSSLGDDHIFVNRLTTDILGPTLNHGLPPGG